MTVNRFQSVQLDENGKEMRKMGDFLTTWMAICAIVPIVNCLSISKNNFLRFGPRHSVTVIVFWPSIPLQIILGTPVPKEKDKGQVKGKCLPPRSF